MIALSVVILFVAFHLFENWRGRKAWAEWQKTVASLGESTRFEDYIPKPIPDEKNLASTPLVKAWFSTEQTNNWDDSAFSKIKITPRLNTNEFGPHQIDLVAWARALREANSTTNDASTLTRREAAIEVLAALNPINVELTELLTASERPAARYPINYLSQASFATLLPHVSQVKKAALRFQVRSAAYLELGRVDEAFADAKAIGRLAQSLEGEPFLISHLIRLAIASYFTQAIWQGRSQWSEQQLKYFHGRLISPNYAQGLHDSLRAERLLGLKTIEVVQNLGPAHYAVFWDEQSIPSKASSKFSIAYFIPRGWFDLERANLYAIHHDLLLAGFTTRLAEFNPHIINQKQEELNNLLGDPEDPKSKRAAFLKQRLFATILTPALIKSVQRTARAQIEANLCATAIILEIHKLKTGSYPEMLESHLPDYMPRIPRDPIGGGQLKYRKTQDSYLLYSIGWNSKDDNGQPGKTFEELDFVW